jgi:hypothetical protein
MSPKPQALHLNHIMEEREMGMILGSGTVTSSSKVTSRPKGAL